MSLKLSSQIQVSSLRKKLLSGGVWALIDRFSIAVTGLIINALLARLLSPNEMGAYLLTLSGVSVLVILGQLGFSQTIVKYIGESIGKNQLSKARTAINITFKYTIPTSLILVAVIFLGGWHWVSSLVFESIPTNLALPVGIWMFLLVVQKLLSETYRGFQNIRLATLFGEFSTKLLTVILLATVWFFYKRADLTQVILLLIFPLLVVVLYAAFSLIRRLRTLANSNDQLKSKKMLSDAFPFLVTNLSLFLLLQFGIWILGAFLPEEEVAIYGLASRLVIIVTMPLLVVNMVVPPYIAELYAKNQKTKLEALLRDIATVVTIPALLFLIGLALFSQTILHFFFGEFYAQGAPILVVLSVGRMADVFAGSCGNLLMMTGYQRIMMMISLISGFLTIAGGLIFVPTHGILGMASVAAIALLFQNIGMLLLAKRSTGIWTHSYVTRVQIKEMLGRHLP